MKLKALLVAVAMAFVSAFTTQAQSQSEIDNVMTEVASQMNQQLAGEAGIESVSYDKATHGVYVNLDKSLIETVEAASLPRTTIKENMLIGMIEEGGSDMKQMVQMLNQLNVKFGIRYTYQGKRYTDLFYPSDFK